MTQFGTSTLASQETSFIQAAEADIMTTLMRALVAEIGDSGNGITALTLSGAGDGYTFITELTQSASPDGEFLGGETTALIYYLAATAEELAVAKAAAVVAMLALTPPAPDYFLTVVDDQLVGASKGTHFMGLIIAEWTAPDIG